ncbi:MAG TPA: DUF4168 domain-containing protein [Gillisia sp.]|nr:DUF4168 domain-containing protein [Gillisia sp.]
MFNTKKFAAFFLFFTVLGSTAIFAQTPQQLPQQEQQMEKVEVSEAELQKFANAFQAITAIGQQAQQEMAGVVENKGMELQRFNEVHQASLDPQAEVTVTSEEQEQHQEIITELETMQVEFQGEMAKVITEVGLTPERYEQIAMGLQYDEELQNRLRAVLQS